MALLRTNSQNFVPNDHQTVDMQKYRFISDEFNNLSYLKRKLLKPNIVLGVDAYLWNMAETF